MGSFRGLTVLAGALAALLVAAPNVRAEAQLCLSDPPLQILLASGDEITVYVTEGAAVQHLDAIQHATISYTARAMRAGASVIRVKDSIPTDSSGGFPVFVIVSSQPFGNGTVYGRATGTAGTPIIVSFLAGSGQEG